MNWDELEEESFKAVYESYLRITNGLIENDHDPLMLAAVLSTIGLSNTKIESDHDPLMLAAVLSTIGLSIYRTMLNETDYDLMIDAIGNFKDEIKTFENSSPKGHLH